MTVQVTQTATGFTFHRPLRMSRVWAVMFLAIVFLTFYVMFAIKCIIAFISDDFSSTIAYAFFAYNSLVLLHDTFAFGKQWV